MPVPPVRKEFAEIWVMKWAELLMIRSANEVSYKSAYLYSTWLTDRISRNVPIHLMVRELLGATGGTFRSPATNFYQIETDTLKTAENVARVFLGCRIQCAQCHNHPFDRWTMDDYYGFASFFCQIGRKPAEDYRETIVFNRGDGSVSHPVTGRAMEPKFLGGPLADAKGRDRRQVLADWLTSPDNPFFAPSIANRVWAHFFGVGIVEPVDDVRVSNPPGNPELIQELGKRRGRPARQPGRVLPLAPGEPYRRAAHAAEPGQDRGGLLVWEAETGREFHNLEGHKGAVTGVSFSPDSNVLASGSEDGSIRLWGMEEGRQLRSFTAHGDGGVTWLEFAHDGRIVSCGRDRVVKLWKPYGVPPSSRTRRSKFVNARCGWRASERTYSTRSVSCSWGKFKAAG